MLHHRVPRTLKLFPSWMWVLITTLGILLIVRFLSLQPLVSSQLKQAEPPAMSEVRWEIGRASWYELKGKTASGELMDPNAFTAAHRSLPLGTEVLVENLENGLAANVRITDRGPYAKGRILDLSREAADKLGILQAGEAKVRIQPLELPSQR